MMDLNHIKELVNSYLEHGDVFLVDVSLEAGRIIVGLDSLQGIDLELCGKLSRHLYAALSPEIEDYELEVGSVGLTAPFKILRQWQNAVGKDVVMVLFSGNKEEGVLSKVTESGCVLTVERMEKPEGAKRKVKVEKQLVFAYSDIKSCTLVIEAKKRQEK